MIVEKEAKPEFVEADVLNEKPLVVVGIPAYNEERTIAKVVLEAQKHADIVVVCDDGSSDLTAEIAERLGAKVVRHSENRGYGGAIQSLFKQSKKLNADVLVTFDADGQHNMEDLPTLLKPILDGTADVVTGSRFIRETRKGRGHIPRLRRFGIKMITKLTNSVSQVKVSDAQIGFRAYNKTALRKLLLDENGMGVSVEILLKAKAQGLRVAESSVACAYGDVEKSSTQNPLRQGTSVITALIRLIIEEHPLALLGLPGIISLFIGAFFGIWMLQIYAMEHHIVTNIALASVAFILVGFFALSTAITLYAISRLVTRTNQKKEPALPHPE